MDEKRRFKYLASGLLFAFALSTTYLPLLCGIVDLHGTHIIGETLGIIFLTLLNYFYIARLKDSRFRAHNGLILIPLNIFLLFFVPNILRLQVEGNVFAFTLIFCAIPWFILICVTYLIHSACSIDRKENPDTISLEQKR